MANGDADMTLEEVAAWLRTRDLGMEPSSPDQPVTGDNGVAALAAEAWFRSVLPPSETADSDAVRLARLLHPADHDVPARESEAAHYLRAALADYLPLLPTDVSLWVLRGRVGDLTADGRTGEAFDLLGRLMLVPRDLSDIRAALAGGMASDCVNRSTAELKRRHHAKALSALVEAISLNPQHIKAWRRIADVLARTENWSGALLAARRLAELTGDGLKTAALRASALSATGRQREALVELLLAKGEHAPGTPYWELLMDTANAVRDDPDAASFLRACMLAFGWMPLLGAALGDVLWRRGDEAAAEREYRRAAVGCKLGEVWLKAGRFYASRRRQARALACLGRAQRLGVRNAVAGELARALDELGQREAAVRLLVGAMIEDGPGVLVHRFISIVARDASAEHAHRPRRRPLALISQVQRSGGTLLSQLLDGHDQLLNHPHEIQIGFPEKWHWPRLDLGQTPAQWLEALFERRLPWFIVRGYTKADGNPAARERPFRFDMSLEQLCRQFIATLTAHPPRTQRDILDAYFDAYFGAWCNYRHSGEEKWVVGFTPRLASNAQSLAGFMRNYPDGLLVSCIRDPRSWYVSARSHAPEFAGLDYALELWKSSTLSSLRAVEKYPCAVHLLTFEELVNGTADVMGALARRLGIAFCPSLLEPTFLGQPILPNSSFRVETPGVNRAAANRSAELSRAEADLIELEAMSLYREVRYMVRQQR